MFPKTCHFRNLSPILPILQKGRAVYYSGQIVLRLSEHGDVIEKQNLDPWLLVWMFLCKSFVGFSTFTASHQMETILMQMLVSW